MNYYQQFFYIFHNSLKNDGDIFFFFNSLYKVQFTQKDDHHYEFLK